MRRRTIKLGALLGLPQFGLVIHCCVHCKRVVDPGISVPFVRLRNNLVTTGLQGQETGVHCVQACAVFQQQALLPCH